MRSRLVRTLSATAVIAVIPGLPALATAGAAARPQTVMHAAIAQPPAPLTATVNLTTPSRRRAAGARVRVRPTAPTAAFGHAGTRREGVVDAGIETANSPGAARKAPVAPATPVVQVSATGGTENGVAPPDPQIAAGPTRVVEVVNSTGYIYDKGGHLVGSPFDLATKFALRPNRAFGDPKILYDGTSSRFFMTGFGSCMAPATCTTAGSPEEITIAVSTTSNPEDPWKTYEVNADATLFDDQPRLGITNDKVMIAFDQFNAAGTAFVNEWMLVLQKADLVNGAPVRRVSLDLGNRFGVNPATQLSSAIADGFAARYDFGVVNDDAAMITVTGKPSTNNVAWTEKTSGIASMHTPIGPIQPGGIGLDGGDNRFQSVTADGFTLYIAANDRCTPSGDSNARGCLRIIKTTYFVPSWQIDADFDIGQNGAGMAYPVAIPDCTTPRIVFAATIASPTQFPSSLVGSVPAPFTGAGTRTKVLANGNRAYNQFSGGKNRWGDYSGISPNRPTCDGIWSVTEFGALADGSWATRISQVTFRAPTITSISPSHGTFGTLVDIFGSGFTPGTVAAFGETPAHPLGFQFVDSNHIRYVAPQHAPGAVRVRVANEWGQSPYVSGANLFAYDALAYVTDKNSNDVRRVNLTTSTSGPPIALTGAPNQIEISSPTSGWVTRPGANFLTPINLGPDTTGGSISIPVAPAGLDLNPAGSRAYVTSKVGAGSTTLTAVDLPAGTTAWTTNLLDLPGPVAVTPDEAWTIVAQPASGWVAIVDNSLRVEVAVVNLRGYTPLAVDTSADDTTGYFTADGPPGALSQLVAFDIPSHTVLWQLELGHTPRYLEVLGNRAYVTSEGDNTLYAVDLTTHAVVDHVTILGKPHGLDVSADGTYLAVADSNSAKVSLVTTNPLTEVTRIPVGNGPEDVALVQPPDSTCTATNFTVPTLEYPDGGDIAPTTKAFGEGTGWFYCSPTGGPLAVQLTYTVTQPSGCPAIPPKTVTTTAFPGPGTFVRTLPKPACLGRYVTQMTMQSAGTFLGTAFGSFSVLP